MDRKIHEILSVSALKPHEKNYRHHSSEQIAALKESLQRFGQTRSLVVREQKKGGYQILAGHGIYYAAKNLGWSSLSCDIFLDLDDSTAEAILIADNRLALSAHDSEEELFQLLQQQKENGYALDALGSSEKELEEFFDQLSWEKERKQLDERKPVFVETYFQEEPLKQEKITGWQRVEPIRSIRNAVDPRDKLAVYEQGFVRQIVLILDQIDYNHMIRRIQQIREKQPSLDTNSKLFFYLVEEYARIEQLAPLEE